MSLLTDIRNNESIAESFYFLLPLNTFKSNATISSKNGTACRLGCETIPKWIEKETKKSWQTSSYSEVKWTCNLLSRGTWCKQESCVCVVVVSCVKTTAWLGQTQIYCQTATGLMYCTCRDLFLLFLFFIFNHCCCYYCKASADCLCVYLLIYCVFWSSWL